MASKLISINSHSVVLRCEGPLDGAAASVLSMAPDQVKARLEGASFPWGLKLVRMTPRHFEYQRNLLSRICEAARRHSPSSLPPMPQILGVWNASEGADVGASSHAVLAVAMLWWGGGCSLLDVAESLDLDGKACAMQALSFAICRLASLVPEPLVHGDIKPTNVFVIRENGVLRAGIVDYDTVFSLRRPRSFPVPGTKGFSAPELSRPSASALLGRADVFSFGAIARRVAPDLLFRNAAFAQLAAACLRRNPLERPSPSQLPELVADALSLSAPTFMNGSGAPAPSFMNVGSTSTSSSSSGSSAHPLSFASEPAAQTSSFMNGPGAPTSANVGKARPPSA